MKDGGPVLPIPTHNDIYSGDNREQIAAHMGLSVRDWFAGMALQGILSVGTQSKEAFSEEELTQRRDTVYANWAYRYADAMLQQREIQP